MKKLLTQLRGVILDDNGPNPFNPRTVIRHQVPTNTKMSPKVYNLLGHEGAAAFKGVRQPGIYETTFDAGHIAGGVYFCRLITDMDFMQTKK